MVESSDRIAFSDCNSDFFARPKLLFSLWAVLASELRKFVVQFHLNTRTNFREFVSFSFSLLSRDLIPVHAHPEHLFLSKNNFPWGGLLSFRLFIFVYCRQMNHLPKTLNFVFLICVRFSAAMCFKRTCSMNLDRPSIIFPLRKPGNLCETSNLALLYRLCTYFIHNVETVFILCTYCIDCADTLYSKNLFSCWGGPWLLARTLYPCHIAVCYIKIVCSTALQW